MLYKLKDNFYFSKFQEMFILQKNAEQVKHLLLAGASPNTKDNAGWTPLVNKAYINTFYGFLHYFYIVKFELCYCTA